MKTTWLLILGLASTGMAQNDEVFRAQKKLEAAADQLKANVMFNQQTFNFVAGQLISGPPVKGAPYSAEAVNETIQTLADGNRIVQRTTAMQYRDTDGRERREETSAMGAIFITDPVAGARFTLHPESRSAEKGPLPVLVSRISPSVAGNVFAYSNSEPLRLKGTVSAMDWINPTAWITLSFKGPDGGTANWKCATAGPNALLKLGWTRNSVKAGDTVTINGSRADGENTCVANSVVLSDGTTLAARAEAPEIGAVGGRGQVTVAVSGRVAAGRGGTPATELHLNGVPLTLVTGGITGPGDAKDVKTEQLGKMYIEGVQAEGTRTTTTIPAGDIGNERPINIVDERWYSPDLQMTVMTKHSDPRAGETNFALKNINRSSPPPNLFEVPSDYTVTTGGGGRGGRGVAPFGIK
jgi:hypothetical protein